MWQIQLNANIVSREKCSNTISMSTFLVEILAENEYGITLYC